MSEVGLNAAQKNEWQVLRKILRWYSQSVTALSPFEVEIWKAYHFGASLPQPRNGMEQFEIESTLGINFLTLLFDPDQSEEVLRQSLSELRALDRGCFAYDWPIKFNQLFEATGYQPFAGKTEWLIGLLIDDWETSRDEWMQSFSFDTLMGEIVKWLDKGGYRQFLVSLFSRPQFRHS